MCECKYILVSSLVLQVLSFPRNFPDQYNVNFLYPHLSHPALITLQDFKLLRANFLCTSVSLCVLLLTSVRPILDLPKPGLKAYRRFFL
jgi:hypothetical protein